MGNAIDGALFLRIHYDDKYTYAGYANPALPLVVGKNNTYTSMILRVGV